LEQAVARSFGRAGSWAAPRLHAPAACGAGPAEGDRWTGPQPGGRLQPDFVAHCGPFTAGSYLWTLCTRVGRLTLRPSRVGW